MKKLISILLVLMLSVSLVACKNNTDTEKSLSSEDIVDVDKNNVDENENKDDIKESDTSANTSSEDSKAETKPAENQTHYPNKPVENNNTVSKPAESKPTETQPAESKPAESKPEEVKPEEKPATLGNKLLAQFKANASSKSGIELGNAIVAIPEIKFSPVVTTVEEGLLTGFSNTEIKGFKSGVVFAPMIGTIPFVGYVFELENASDVSSFISTLKTSANLRWNVCTEADEMITGSYGNKVFFVMCPTEFED